MLHVSKRLVTCVEFHMFFQQICHHRQFSSTAPTSSSRFKDIFVSNKDLRKRPSDQEIEKKGLPKNTPTLEERLRRDNQSMVYVPDRKGGYYKGPTGTIRDFIPKDYTLHDGVKEGLQAMKEEILKWKKETIDAEWEPLAILPGTSKSEWQFDTDEKRNNWIVTCDSSWGEGYSTASLTPSASGRGAIFSGELVTRPPPDGRTAYAGYANFKSVMKRRSFYRVDFYDWSQYTHLTMKIRGDGRSYNINLHTYGDFDITWHDLWQYPLYTRGGPYWQTVKIPFSKFYFSSRGYVQDSQSPPPTEEIAGIGISLMDRIDGPFFLEIEEIGVIYDANYKMHETTAYETYQYIRPGYNLY